MSSCGHSIHERGLLLSMGNGVFEQFSLHKAMGCMHGSAGWRFWAVLMMALVLGMKMKTVDEDGR